MEGKPMSVIDKLNDRIRSKITPEISARITAMRGREQGIEIVSDTRDPQWVHKAQIEESAPGLRM
jgi:hypothetical protein